MRLRSICTFTITFAINMDNIVDIILMTFSHDLLIFIYLIEITKCIIQIITLCDKYKYKNI